MVTSIKGSPVLLQNTFISRLLYFGDIGGYEKERENISPPILYAELKAHIRNGEPGEHLMYFLLKYANMLVSLDRQNLIPHILSVL